MALDKIKIGARIRKIRDEEYEETREKFSERIGITPNYIAKIERGEGMISINLLDTLCSVTGADSDYILYGKSLNKTLSTRRSIDNLLNNSSKEELQVFYRMLSILKSQYVLKTEIEENKNEKDNKKAQ